MTPEFLNLFIQHYPNSYELGEMVRKFYFFYKENELILGTKEIEQTFIKTHLTKK